MPRPKPNGRKPTTPAVQRAAVYVRVSSERQGERVSPEAQLAECEQYAQQHGYTVTAVYTDTERYRSRGRLVEPSGTRTDRPDFQRMLADARAGRFDVILAWKADRLYRGVKPAVLVGDLLEETPVTVELVKETFDRKFLYIMAAIGRLEIESFRERAEMGMKARMRAGMIHGGPVPAGYTAIKGDDGTAAAYVLDPAWQPFFDDLARWYLKRLPLTEVARRLGYNPATGKPWNSATLSTMLRNPFYRGQVAYGWQSGRPEFTAPGRHVSPWDEMTIAAIERELARRGGKHNAPRSRALLSGILRCGICGYPMACGTTKNYRPNRETHPYAYRQYGCRRPDYVRRGLWYGRRAHGPNYINEKKALGLVGELLAGVTPADIDDFLARAAAALGGPAPDDGARRDRLETEAAALRGKLADLAVGLEGVREASPSAAEAIVSAMTTAGQQLDRVRADLRELDERRSAAPDLRLAREAMLRLVETPDLLAHPERGLQGLLQAAFPAIYVAGGEIVAPMTPWED